MATIGGSIAEIENQDYFQLSKEETKQIRQNKNKYTEGIFMIPSSRMIYGKKYRLVMSCKTRREGNVYADMINKIFGDYGNPGSDIRKKLQNMKTLVYIEHLTDEDGSLSHNIYVKEPYDKLVKDIRK